MTRHGAPGRKPGGAKRFVGPLLAVVFVCFDIPVLFMLSYSLSGPQGLTLANYGAVFSSPVFARVIANTLRISLIATAVSAVLGYALAYWISGLRGWTRNLALMAVVLPFWVSILVRTYAWIVVLGNGGLVNRFLQWSGLSTEAIQFLYTDFGVIVGMVNISIPLFVLPLYAAMIRIDRRYMQAAASLGASNSVIFWKVFFPISVPAFLSSILLVFILCLGFYVTPAVLGGGRVPMVANMLDTYINRIPRWGTASAVSTVLLIITLALFAGYRRANARLGAEAP